MSVRNALIDNDLIFAQAIEGAIVAARGGDPLGGLASSACSLRSRGAQQQYGR